MKAAVVREFGHPPTYGEFEEPVAEPGETKVSVTAAAVSHLVRGRVTGSHYSAVNELPFVPGVDGVGRTSDGRRVYFGFSRPPFGSLAERTVVASDLATDVPEGLDDVTAAAAANPGMSCWIPLTRFARVRSDESVLVNGATGIAGRMAVQVARYLGASKVIATGRNKEKLRGLSELGADVLLPLDQPIDTFREVVRREARDTHLGIVLDYLWGTSTEAILKALGGPDAPRGPSRVRYIGVGGVSGDTITLSSAVLRSSGVEVLGTGLGSSSYPTLVGGIGEFLRAFVPAGFKVDVEVHPLSEVEKAWDGTPPEKRLVLTVL